MRCVQSARHGVGRGGGSGGFLRGIQMPASKGYRTAVCAVSGCARRPIARAVCTKHYQRQRKRGTTEGFARREAHGEKCAHRVSAEYRCWQGMRTRCSNPRSPSFPYYGGRGIRVCQRWDASFLAFLEDMGRRPSEAHTIDRIDNDGDYGPANCRWATRAEQSRNRRPFSMVGKSPLAKLITANGVTDSIAGWARRLGVDRGVVRGRLRRGWDPVRAVTEPNGTTPSGPKRRAA